MLHKASRTARFYSYPIASVDIGTLFTIWKSKRVVLYMSTKGSVHIKVEGLAITINSPSKLILQSLIMTGIQADNQI